MTSRPSGIKPQNSAAAETVLPANFLRPRDGKGGKGKSAITGLGLKELSAQFPDRAAALFDDKSDVGASIEHIDAAVLQRLLVLWAIGVNRDLKYTSMGVFDAKYFSQFIFDKCKEQGLSEEQAKNYATAVAVRHNRYVVDGNGNLVWNGPADHPLGLGELGQHRVEGRRDGRQPHRCPRATRGARPGPDTGSPEARSVHCARRPGRSRPMRSRHPRAGGRPSRRR